MAGTHERVGVVSASRRSGSVSPFYPNAASASRQRRGRPGVASVARPGTGASPRQGRDRPVVCLGPLDCLTVADSGDSCLGARAGAACRGASGHFALGSATVH